MRIVVDVETEGLEEDEVLELIEDALARDGIIATAYFEDEADIP